MAAISRNYTPIEAIEQFINNALGAMTLSQKDSVEIHKRSIEELVWAMREYKAAYEAAIEKTKTLTHEIEIKEAIGFALGLKLRDQSIALAEHYKQLAPEEL